MKAECLDEAVKVVVQMGLKLVLINLVEKEALLKAAVVTAVVAVV